MEKIKKTLENLNVRRLNELFKISSKILKLIYIVLIVLVVYSITLILKEWNIFPILLSVLKIITPFFIGFVIAWLLNPLVTKLSQKGMTRIGSTILIFFILLIVLYFFTLLLLPGMAKEINEIVSSIPIILEEIQDFISGIFDKIGDSSLVNLDSTKEQFFTTIESFGKDLMTNLPTIFVNFIKGMISGLGIIAFSFIIGFYMLFNFDQVNQHLLNLLPKKFRRDGKKLIQEISGVMFEYVKGTLIISFLVFVICSIGFSIIGLNAPILFGLFCGVTNLIPYLGPYIGAVPAILVGFTDSVFIGTASGILILIVQLLESMFLQPIVMSKKTNLHPVTIIIVLLIFGYFFGIIGMILATPIAALIKIIYNYFKNKYEFFEYKNEKKEISKVKK